MKPADGPVPRLRFPEFRDAGPWEVKRLGEILVEHRLKSTGHEEVFSVSVHKGLINQVEHLGRSFAAGSTDHYNLVRPGDVVYTKSPTGDFPLGVVKQSKHSRNVIVSPLYGVFSPMSRFVGALLDAYFESPSRARVFLDPLTQKGAKNTINISNDTFLSGEIALPNLPPEQHKIADCLTSLDELIRAEGEVLAALRDHKRGLMQRLFPRPGETTPRLRFPEFRDAGPWEVKRLGEILVEHRLKSTGHEEVFSVSVHKGLINQVEHLGRSFAADSTDHYNLVRPGDVVYTKSPTGDFPLGVVKQSKHSHNVIVSPLYGVFSPMSLVVGALLDAYFESPSRARVFLDPLTQKGAKNTINISNDTFLSGEIALPNLPPEQHRIADCLASLDELIRAQGARLEALKAHKRGLMQQLFPQAIA